jgi:DNA-binding MarR family transcriptional regulator
MQATAASTQASARELAGALFAVFAYMVKSSNRDAFRAMADEDVSLTHFKALHVLDAQEDDLSLKEVGEELALSLPAVSRLIDHLHQRGFVERDEDERDRRMKRVRITPAGRNLVQRLIETRMSMVEQLIQTLTETERRRLIAGITPLLERDEVRACRPQKV